MELVSLKEGKKVRFLQIYFLVNQKTMKRGMKVCKPLKQNILQSDYKKILNFCIFGLMVSVCIILKVLCIKVSKKNIVCVENILIVIYNKLFKGEERRGDK